MPTAFPSAVLGAGRPLTLRGAGHSCDGQTVAGNELLVTYDPAGTEHQVREVGEDAVEVPAGTSWRLVERYLNARGRTVPVLTDHLPVSVGGTLSVGGLGATSLRYGMQVDQVERIQLTDGAGVSRWCSRTEHSELFRFALGGLGTLGLIERAVLRTVPLPRTSRLHRRSYPRLDDLVAYTEQIAARDDVDSFCASLRRGELSSTIGLPDAFSRSRGDRWATVRHTARAELAHGRPVAPPDGWVRMWSDYVVPAGWLAPLVGVLRSRVPLARLPVMLYFLVLRRPADATAFAFAPIGAAEVSIGMGVYMSVRRTPAAVESARRVFGALLEACAELGGRPYLYGVHDFEGSLVERLYGPDPARLAQLRSAYGLEHVNAHLPLVRAAVSAAGQR
ncbi:FAD-binding oxidoreductase [Nocardia grenadensis]|uniref:FAD-binding oxidoreductase n=1 Tax=Nocardia grenadensis TaxID=931537 RepID=UPI003D75AF2E